MTKATFVELVQKHGEYETKIAAEKAIKAFTEAIADVMSQRENITLVGFGSFHTTEVAEKTGIVPGTKNKYIKPAHFAPKFKMGKTLKDATANGLISKEETPKEEPQA